ncbi:MAG: hypothetical protein ACTSRP_01860 [Candidatus Helarchaeota archaeon]
MDRRECTFQEILNSINFNRTVKENELLDELAKLSPSEELKSYFDILFQLVFQDYEFSVPKEILYAGADYILGLSSCIEEFIFEDRIFEFVSPPFMLFMIPIHTAQRRGDKEKLIKFFEGEHKKLIQEFGYMYIYDLIFQLYQLQVLRLSNRDKRIAENMKFKTGLNIEFSEEDLTRILEGILKNMMIIYLIALDETWKITKNA